ncbi:hypothetical protein PQX77_011232 [Marasmius sp. AFHP31]|nr:hypothetical protein PQX77_011232 [Marasmius sp. AFHP31]
MLKRSADIVYELLRFEPGYITNYRQLTATSGPTPSSRPPRPSSPKPDRPKWKPPVQPAIGGKGSVADLHTTAPMNGVIFEGNKAVGVGYVPARNRGHRRQLYQVLHRSTLLHCRQG